MKKIIHKAESRGSFNHGWLKTYHTFSFSQYYDPERMNFGKLRVLNDDIIAPGNGFGRHPHQNMEIITVPLAGELAHEDSTGNSEILRPYEIQVMSAGSGIYHSEFNASDIHESKLLQLWIMTDKDGHEPRYDQKQFDIENLKNKVTLLVGPEGAADLWIHQNAYISRVLLDEKKSVEYSKKVNDNGVYIFVIDGEIELTGETLEYRDGIGLTGLDKFDINAKKESDILIIEIPM